jgi:hypothetical protein
MASKDGLNGDYLGDYLGQYSLLEAAKNRVREVKDGISVEPLVHLQGTRIPWGVACDQNPGRASAFYRPIRKSVPKRSVYWAASLSETKGNP